MQNVDSISTNFLCVFFLLIFLSLTLPEKLVLDHHYHDFDPGVIRIPLSHSCPNSSECPDRSDLIPRSLSSTKYSERRRRNGANISKFSFPPKMKEMILHDFIASSRSYLLFLFSPTPLVFHVVFVQFKVGHHKIVPPPIFSCLHSFADYR